MFWDAIDINKCRKVLVIPNITNSANIEKDSFVDVIYNHINALKSLGDFYWHIMLPTPVAKLNLDTVKQHIVDISGDMIHMRVTFPRKAINLLQELEYDVIYSHLPDWYMVKRYTDKPIIGYTHWWEMKSCNAEDRKNRQRNIVPELLGVLGMEVCYLNTQDQKNRVLDEAREWFNDAKIQELDRILQVWHLGVPAGKIIDQPTDKEKIIVFNHLIQSDYEKIAELEMSVIVEKLTKKGYSVNYNDQVISALILKGVDTVKGARGLAQVRREQMEDKLADILIKSIPPRGSIFEISYKDKEDDFIFTIKKPEKQLNLET